MIITEIQYFFSKIIRFQAIFKDTVEFTCALEFKISSQPASKGKFTLVPAILEKYFFAAFLFHSFSDKNTHKAAL